MEITAIEKKTFEQMKQRFEDFAKQVKILCGENQNKEKWLTGNDVCELLQISARSLQSYRDKGTLPYSQIGHKCYYKASDVEQLINQSQIKK
jgi:prophage antirepressor-like protein